MNFRDFNLDARIHSAIDKMGFTQPSPIQEMVINPGIEGKDIIASSKTGTGKTVAFSIPIIQNLDFSEDTVQALVLAPTRELANQVNDEISKLLRFYDRKSVAIYGGEHINDQIRRLKSKPIIVVATPGRLMDHMRRRTIRLDNVNFVVLDEADEMLSMGFDEDVKTILEDVPADRQTLLFSATITDRVKKLSEKFMRDPVYFSVKSDSMTVDKIDQYYFEVEGLEKLDLLTKILDVEKPSPCIIFCKTKKRVDELTTILKDAGYRVEGMHGDLKQDRREKILSGFKRSNFDIFIATDVAARGLDIDDISHVINFDLPQDVEIYVHRIGRTGRAGKTGIAYTFCSKGELFFIDMVKKEAGSKIKRLDVPTEEETIEKLIEREIEILKSQSKVNVSPEILDLVKNSFDGEDKDIIIAATLEAMFSGARKTAKGVLTRVEPLGGSKKGRGKGRSGGRGKDGRSSFGGRVRNRRSGGYSKKKDGGFSNKDGSNRNNKNNKGGGIKKNYNK